MTMITGASACSRGLRLGLFGDQHLDRPALLVEAVELGGDGPRFLGVGRGQQAHAEVGLADPAAGVDPRAQARSRGRGSVGALDQPRRLGQRGEADVLPRRP